MTLFDSADWRPIRSVRARDVGWSILDCAYSPDMRFLAYSSWSSSLHLGMRTRRTRVCFTFESDSRNSYQSTPRAMLRRTIR